VRYVCQLIDIDKGFVDKIRQYQASNGGLLTLNGETYVRYMGTVQASVDKNDIAHAIRAKSIKSLFTVFQDRAESLTANAHTVGHRVDPNISSWGWRIGSRRYPPTNVQHHGGQHKVAETAQELWKAIGVQAGTNTLHGTLITKDNFVKAVGAQPDGSAGQNEYGTFAIGLDLDVWSGHGGIESGVNTSDRALSCTLELTHHTQLGANKAVDCMTYAMVDCLFYIDQSGQISPSI
jgi:hypothetical protein